MVQVDVEKNITSGDIFLSVSFTSSIVLLEAFASIRVLSKPSFLKYPEIIIKSKGGFLKSLLLLPFPPNILWFPKGETAGGSTKIIFGFDFKLFSLLQSVLFCNFESMLRREQRLSSNKKAPAPDY